jgi:hypothetical protein
MINAKQDPKSPNTLFVFYCTFPEEEREELDFRVASFTSLLGAEEAENWVKIIVSQIFGVQEGGP